MDSMRCVGSWVFYGDEGAIYDVLAYADGTTIITGRATRVAYTSKDHRLSITGSIRRQPTGVVSGRTAYNVDGSRCILTLDTGEGLDDLRGVLVSP